MEKSELLERCKRGERQALDQLYRQHKPRLLGICKQYTKDDSVAEDLLHDSFVVILTSLDRLSDTDRLESWMTSIVQHVGYHYAKRTEKEQTALRLMDRDGQETAAAALTPDYEQLQTLVGQLPEGYQQVFRLSVFEGLSHQEIGSLLGIAPHSSSSQLSHAKRMLRQLIRQSWVLILLLIAIPALIWKMAKQERPTRPTIADRTVTPSDSKPDLPTDTIEERPVDTAVGKTVAQRLIDYQTETVIAPDTIPYHATEKEKEEETPPADQITGQQDITPQREKPHFTPDTKHKRKWDIRLAYNGTIGQHDDYMASAEIMSAQYVDDSFTAATTTSTYYNWADYNQFLMDNIKQDMSDETRSLMNIAKQNSNINGGAMEARHEHQLPLTVQLTVSRQLANRLSIETGLSYTYLKSSTTTGSNMAYIYEQQRIRYLGIPLHIGWQWYRRAHLSLYSTAGGMLELPLSGRVNVKHVDEGHVTFSKENKLDVPIQWSATMGIGIQYNLTPHVGLYVEPTLQYFFNDGSDIESYRTEHPLSLSLPFGVRLHW